MKQKTGGSKIASALISLLLIIAFLGVFTLLIKIDVGGFGSQVLRPILKDVPVINTILPKSNELDKNYPYKTVEEAIQQIKNKENIINAKEQEYSDLLAQIETLNKEITRLKVFEKNQTQFEQDKKTFDELVVFNTKAISIEEYKAFYENIYPQNAEEIYRQVVEKVTYSKEVKDFAQTYQDMKAEKAAKIIEEMSSDLDLVVDILNNIDSEQRGKILGAMDPKVAARVTKKLAP